MKEHQVLMLKKTELRTLLRTLPNIYDLIFLRKLLTFFSLEWCYQIHFLYWWRHRSLIFSLDLIPFTASRGFPLIVFILSFCQHFL